jgi:hypothetical protein
VYHTPSSSYQYCFDYFGYSQIHEDMCVYIYIYIYIFGPVLGDIYVYVYMYMYIEECLVINTVSETETDLIRWKVACVRLHVISTCVQVLITCKRDLSVCSAVPQPTAPSRAPVERVEQLIYLGKTLTNQNYIQGEIKNRLKSRNFCYHSAQNLLSSTSLFKK